jgi:anti-sigma-K factor RskA
MNLFGRRPGRTAAGSEAHTLAGAYAMDAVSPSDRAAFERHLAGCQECAREIASLREATARLATATAVTPPSGLRDRVLAAAAMTRQQPPAEPEPEAHGTRRWAAAILASVRGGAKESAARLRLSAGLGWLAGRDWRVRLAVVAGALLAVAVLGTVVVFGVANGSMRQQLDRAQVSSQQIAAVLTARDAVMRTRPVAGGGTATIVMSHSRRALVFTATGLRALPTSRGYELWLVGPKGDRPVGMLPPGRDGMTGPVIASGLRQGDHLVLTAEPAGGASRPTMPAMLDLVV